MSLATVSGIIIATAGALILGMAVLIKSMVVGRLDALQAGVDGMREDIHGIDVRVTKLETAHELRTCRYGEAG